jgi:hypothetical protein
MNRFTGVLGVYNRQGAAWSSAKKKNVFHDAGGVGAGALTCSVKGRDVHLIAEAATDGGAGWSGDCTVYRHASGDLVVLPDGAALPVSLKVLDHDVLTVTPSRRLRSAKHKHIASTHFCNVQLLCLVYVDGSHDLGNCRIWRPGTGSHRSASSTCSTMERWWKG